MLKLSDKWIEKLMVQRETGMGYYVATIILENGKKFEQAVIDSGYITKIKDISNIPFVENEIKEIIVTHDKWDFNHE